MSIASVDGLVETLRQLRLLELAELEELPALQASFPQPKALARELSKRGWLSPYQANQLFQGHGQQLVLGTYVLLDKLGAGGMGAVFKARNMPLVGLDCRKTRVTDLSPLEDLPLKTLDCDIDPERDGTVLRSIKTLEQINDRPAAAFWKELEAPTSQ